ncbi:PAB0415 family putative ATP pyrophosphatase [Thermococcus gammatolerans]|uniref:N-type ATP pyrophosphatase, putative n=1 Tax=Thermococcus gammatolerans (strain DSM 15229 / JCM 11827 / EJ3) TaxID=593117 RepID=C5A482_THEGJ|nr:diphthine--ammonia ligase [Thermococcus gammatolerans]ACS33044.1 N-type ATP pyrophosphatase, putative [Thermococcus gammatolerans EJ3]
MRGVAFFSGGKDGLYAVHLAEKNGIEVPYLLALKTTIGLSPHWENFSALKTLAEAMGKELFTFDMSRGSKALAEFIGSLDVDYLIAGDVLLEDHLRWIERLAEGAGVKPLEPLWGRDTRELAEEILNAGFEHAIIAVNREKLGKEWLGYTFRSLDDLELFLEKNPGIDPVGEFGEFHTVVLASPLFKGRFALEIISTEESERYHWVRSELRKR